MRNRPVVLVVTGITALLATGAGIALAAAPEPVRPAAFAAPTTPSAPDAPGELSSSDAADVALRHVGGGQVTEIEREFEHGRREWKVEIVHDGREHDVRVDAVSGAVTRTDVDDD